MDITDSVRRYFALTMPGETDDRKPTGEELLQLWKEFKVESSEVGHEFSSFLPTLKSAQEINIVKKIIKTCNDLSLFAEENIQLTDEVIKAKRYFNDQKSDLLNIVDVVLSIFSNKPTELEKRESSFIKKGLSKEDKIRNKYEDLNNKYFNYCYEAERVFFKTFKGKPI